MELIFQLNEDDKNFKKLINQHKPFTHTLIPNYINIFSLKKFNQDIKEYIFYHSDSLFHLILPVYKHLWINSTLYLDSSKNSFKVFCGEIIKLKDDIVLFDYSNLREELNKIIFEKNYIIEKDCVTIKIYSEVYNFTFEAFAYLFLDLVKKINNQIIQNSIGHLFFYGLFEAGIKLNFISIPFEQKEKADNNKYGLSFDKINLKSLYISNQIRLWDIWKNKKDCLLTGGTGIGKTSQVTKLFWWFNFLFDGYDDYILDNIYNFNFDINNLKIISRNTTLSLPRKFLINENSLSISKSLGFNKIKDGPINCKYKDVKETEFYNPNAIRFKTPFIFSVNRSTTYENVNTIIFDEIHEHDTFCDIGISIVRKHKIKYKIRNMILITATIVDDLPILQKFIPEIQHVHIEGNRLYDVQDFNFSDTCNIKNNYKNLENIITTYCKEGGKSTLIFFSSSSQLQKFYERLNKNLNINFYKIFLLSRNTLQSNKNLLDEIKNIDLKLHAVVLTTPVAESSITIPNARNVIDTGLFFSKQFFSGSTISITKSMQEQRRGRVGRVSEGNYIALFGEVNKNYKKIDYEFLFPYIVYGLYHKLNLENDFFIKPTNIKRFSKTIKYYEKIGLDFGKINKLYYIYNSFPVSLDEQYVIFMNSESKTQTNFLKKLEDLDTIEKKEMYINMNSVVAFSISKTLNIKCVLMKKTKFYSIFSIKNYFEEIPNFISNHKVLKNSKTNFLLIPEFILS